MYNRARFKLTVAYSVLLLFLCWALSFGLYFWFRQSLGEGYITQVRQLNNPSSPGSANFDVIHRSVATIAGRVATVELRNILILLNGGLIFLIPISSWYLTNKTLNPINKAYEQQKQFVSDASHELRTPLSILSGEMELALNKNRTLTEYKQTIASSKEEIDRLTDLVRNLLFLARGDHVGQRILIQEIDITDLLGTLLTKYDSRLKAKKLHVEFKPAAENQIVNGSESMLQTLFSNLIDNAVKYTRKNGKVVVSIARDGNFAVIGVKDTGIGIPAEDTKKIFDRFYRSDYSRSAIKGFGLGLSISKSIVDMHKGKISVISRLDKGTTFRVYLPIT
jgi:signal transduction histidine kinase